MNSYSDKEKDFYSENELILIRFCGFESLIAQDEIQPPTLYDLMAMHCFIENRKGWEVEAIRWAVSMLHKGKVYRHTPEFEEELRVLLKRRL